MAGNRRTSAITDAPSEPFKTRERALSSLPGPVADDGADSRAAASMWGGFSNQIGKIADGLAQEEGKAQGEADAMSGKVPALRRDSTLSGEAYDRAVLSTYQNKLERETRDGLADIYVRNINNPENMRAEMEAFRQEKFLPNLIPNSPAHRAQMEDFFAARAKGYTVQAAHDINSKVKDQARATAIVNLDAAERERVAAAEAEARGVPGARERRLRAEGEALRIVDGNEGLSETQKAQKKLEMRDQSAVDIELARFRRLTPDEQTRSLKALEAGEPLKGEAAKISVGGREALMRGFRDVLTGQRTEARQRRELWKTRLEQMDERTDALIAVPDAEFKTLEQDAEASGDETVKAALRAAKEKNAAARQLAGLAPAMLDRSIDMLQQEMKGGGDPAQFQRLQFVEKVRDAQRKALDENQLGYAARTLPGLKFEPVDLGNADSVKSRIALAETAAQTFGRKVEYFERDERRRLKERIEKGDETSLAILQGIAENFGGKASAALVEVTKDSPELAHVGRMMATGDRQLARDAMRGIQLRRDPNYKQRDLPRDQIDALVHGEVGGAFANMPQALSEVTAAARTVQEGRSYGLRASPDLGSSDGRKAFGEALRQMTGERQTPKGITGGIEIVNGAPTLIPPGVYNATRNRRLFGGTPGFKDVLVAINDDDLKAIGVAPVGISGQALSARELSRWYWVATQGGGYNVQRDPPGTRTPELVVGKDGNTLIIPWKPLEARLRARRPDLFGG